MFFKTHHRYIHKVHVKFTYVHVISSKKLAESQTHSNAIGFDMYVCVFEFKVSQQNAYLHGNGFKLYHVGKISSKHIQYVIYTKHGIKYVSEL